MSIKSEAAKDLFLKKYNTICTYMYSLVAMFIQNGAYPQMVPFFNVHNIKKYLFEKSWKSQ